MLLNKSHYTIFFVYFTFYTNPLISSLFYHNTNLLLTTLQIYSSPHYKSFTYHTTNPLLTTLLIHSLRHYQSTLYHTIQTHSLIYYVCLYYFYICSLCNNDQSCYFPWLTLYMLTRLIVIMIIFICSFSFLMNTFVLLFNIYHNILLACS